MLQPVQDLLSRRDLPDGLRMWCQRFNVLTRQALAAKDRQAAGADIGQLLRILDGKLTTLIDLASQTDVTEAEIVGQVVDGEVISETWDGEAVADYMRLGMSMLTGRPAPAIGMALPSHPAAATQDMAPSLGVPATAAMPGTAIVPAHPATTRAALPPGTASDHGDQLIAAGERARTAGAQAQPLIQSYLDAGDVNTAIAVTIGRPPEYPRRASATSRLLPTRRRRVLPA